MILSIIGSPGSGKTTQAIKLSKALNIPLLEVGKELRLIAQSSSPLGIKVASYLKSGELVPEPIIRQLFFSWIKKHHNSNGFIIDGFPRRLKDLVLFQKKILPEIPIKMLPYIGAFELNVSLQTSQQRIEDRHAISGHRSDETKETTRHRYNLYKRNRVKVKNYYNSINKWIEINGEPNSKIVQKILKQKINGQINKYKDQLIMIIGAAGSGKDTQAMKLEPLGYHPFSSGAIYRSEMENKTILGNFIRERYMNAGKPVPNKYHFKMLSTHLAPMLSAGNKIVATGIVRKESQARWLDQYLAARGDLLSKVIYLEVPKKDLIERLSLRRICPKCGFNYHLKFIPPKREGVCDKDGAKLIQREDETPSAIKTRLKLQFYDVFKPVFDYYKASSRLIVVDGKPAPEIVEKSVKKALSS